MKRVLGVLAIGSGVLVTLFFLRAPFSARAEPLAQATTAPTSRPTDEPTKPPYVFPTPIFIPTFAPDTSAPSATRAPTGTPITPPAGGTTYTIESGDSLWTIARKVYGDPTKYRLIQQANNLPDNARLRRGQVLVIPPLTPVATPTSLPLPTATATPTFAVSPTALAAISPTPTPAPASSPIPMVTILVIIAGFFCAVVIIGFTVTMLVAYRRQKAFASLQERVPTLARAPASSPPPAPPERLK